MSENTILFALYRMGYRGRATGHGFRATASSYVSQGAHRAGLSHKSGRGDEKANVIDTWIGEVSDYE